jgi:hypothetical protein
MLKTVCMRDKKTGLHDDIDHKQAVEKAATSQTLSLWLLGKVCYLPYIQSCKVLQYIVNAANTKTALYCRL